MLEGMIYDANNDSQLIAERVECKELCYDYNTLRPKDAEMRREIILKILGSAKEDFLIEQPFLCDYGYNIHIGNTRRSSSKVRRQRIYCPQLRVLYRRPPDRSQ